MSTHAQNGMTAVTKAGARRETPHLVWLRERWPDLTESLADLLRSDGRKVPEAWRRPANA